MAEQKPIIKYEVAALCIVFALHVVHFASCVDSALPGFAAAFTNSDMHANLMWAESIVEQGLLNPQPFHPYNNWMMLVAPYATWVTWWGGAAPFQQSPLYAYFLAMMLTVSGNIVVVHAVQTFLGFLLCVSIGALSRIVFESRAVGLIAFIIAGLYAPFYAYSWHLLRDSLGWLITTVFAILMVRWWRAWGDREVPPVHLSIGLGIALAVGLLAREIFYLLVLIVAAAGGMRALRHRRYGPVVIMFLSFLIGIAPLMIRNAAVGAPLFSTSTRFAEMFILYNSPSASGTDSMLPPETRTLFERSNGLSKEAVIETMAMYEGDYLPWVRKAMKKVLSLLDPYEAPDNVNIYYMQLVSPVVRYGLAHWLVIVPGILGLILGILRRDTRQAWLWVLLGCFLINVILFTPQSRYRQTLCLLWIPWAGFYLHYIFSGASLRRLAWLALMPAGWLFCLYISPERPPWEIYRIAEFKIAVHVYESQGDGERANAEIELYQRMMRPRNE